MLQQLVPELEGRPPYPFVARVKVVSKYQAWLVSAGVVEEQEQEQEQAPELAFHSRRLPNPPAVHVTVVSSFLALPVSVVELM